MTLRRQQKIRAAGSSAMRAVALTLVILVLVSSCGQSDSSSSATQDSTASTEPAQLAFRSEDNVDAPSEQLSSFAEQPNIELGNSQNPFVELPIASKTLAVVTETGVAMPVLGESGDSWTVQTPCRSIISTSNVKPVGRAHVVLDPGHGGVEPGAVGSSGLTEKALNLQVALRAQNILEGLGAKVVLTRSSDHTLSLRARADLVRAVQPALFVSIHHNGGDPPLSDEPGTIVFTKANNDEADRFGGIFYETLGAALDEVAKEKREQYQNYIDAVDNHDVLVEAYDQSLARRDEILVANGQIAPEAASTVPDNPAPLIRDGFRVPKEREPVTTTTRPPTVDIVLPVPDALPVPEPLESEPVREFKWSGAGNAGARSWSRPESQKDYLGVLRLSGKTPAALVEFLYLTNVSEEELLADDAFIDREANALADSIVEYFSNPTNVGEGHVADQFEDQDIGGGGKGICVEPILNLNEEGSS